MGTPQDCKIDSSGIHVCTKCGKEGPVWFIVKPGSGICLDCSGVHRSLSVRTPVRIEQAKNNMQPLTDPLIELPSSSSDDVVPPSVETPPPPAAAADDDDDDDDDDGDDYQMIYPIEALEEDYVVRRRRRFIGQTTVELIAKHLCSVNSMGRGEDPYSLLYSQLRSIPKRQRPMFMHKMDSLCYKYLKYYKI